MAAIRGRSTLCSSPQYQSWKSSTRACLTLSSYARISRGTAHAKAPVHCLDHHKAQTQAGPAHEPPSQNRVHATADDLWSLQKSLILRQIDQLDNERQAWTRREQDLLQEIRELQTLYRTAVRDAYQDVFEREQQRWQQERQVWTEKESSLREEVAALKAQLASALAQISRQQQPPQTVPSTLPQVPLPPPPSASQQVADLVRSFSSASTTSTPIPTSFQPPLQQPKASPPTSLLGAPQAIPPAPFAIELAAAMAAVDAVDVLQEKELDAFMTEFRTSQAKPPPSPPTPPSFPPSPPTSHSPGSPPLQQQQPASLPSSPPIHAAGAVSAIPAGPQASPQPLQSALSSERGSSGVQEAGGGSKAPAPTPHHVFVEDASASKRGAAMEKTPYETILAPPNGPPPLLKIGDNDIFWVSRLHCCLASHGFYPSDEEVEDFCFGESTADATATFQASVNLPETGVANEATWKLLLMGTPDESKLIPGNKAIAQASNPSWYSLASWGDMEDGDLDLSRPSPSKAASESGSGSGSGSESGSGSVKGGGSKGAAAKSDDEGGSGSGSSSSSGGGDSEGLVLTHWPVLRETDGGAEVHGLQVALTQAGYGCDEDERQWWMFGSTTREALIYFQACAGLDETGVCDEATWKALLGGKDAVPSDILKLRDGEFDDDVSKVTKKVWLLGEQRWSTV